MKFVLLPTGFSVSIEAKSLLSYCFYKSCQTCGSIKEKKKTERNPGNGRKLYKLEDGVTALAPCFVL